MSEPQVESVKLGELNCWKIRTAQCELLVAQQGAHVLSYQRNGEQPLIWLNDHAVFKQGTPIRAGVPVCWPWFGNLARNPQSVQAMRQSSEAAPAHGLVRALDWELLGIQQSAEGVTVEFTVPQAGKGELPGWAHKVDVRLSLLLGEGLQISLTSHNLDDHAVSLSQALHSYFSVSDVRSVTAEGLDGLDYIETLEDWQQRHQAGDLQFTGETDRIYLQTPAELGILDPDWNRRIKLTSAGSASTVVWNPWTGRAAQLSDMADDGWQQMLCIETANVLDDAVDLAPGASHTLSITICAEKL
ncbi:D-hexose-6-phosphate mutarotase [Pseudomonas sp. nanlin1]|uniref:D-hexose-6-phosphate mutarotase n=1 Tax=Pseudomonas sp. nanlin1 TaxID=3040605 RepID=UPI00388D2256